MSKNNLSHMHPQPIRVPPMKPQKVSFWFTVFEKQLEAAGIERDSDKVATLFGCLESEYLERLEDVDLDSTVDSQYDRLKEELIRSLAESDSERVKRLVEKEVMGDRKPSQFYHDLKKLASPLASDQFILTLWKNRLPDRIRRVLEVMDDISTDKIIQVTDRVEEACSGSDQREARVASVSKRKAQDDAAPSFRKEMRKERREEMSEELREELRQINARINALSISVCRRMRSRSHSPGRRRRRSTSRNGLCYYYDLYRERARKCRSPCR